jgi:Lhr-like helicase
LQGMVSECKAIYKGESMEERTDRFTAIEDRFAGYEVYDQAGSKIGKVDDLFVDESDNPEYIGVKMGGELYRRRGRDYHGSHR